MLYKKRQNQIQALIIYQNLLQFAKLVRQPHSDPSGKRKSKPRLFAIICFHRYPFPLSCMTDDLFCNRFIKNIAKNDDRGILPSDADMNNKKPVMRFLPVSESPGKLKE